MKHSKYILFTLFANIGIALACAYCLVTARSYFNPASYVRQPNFFPLLWVTAVFVFVYNNTVQLAMYFWYRWKVYEYPYYVQKFFPRLLILTFATVLLLFMQFVLGLRETTLHSSGYLKVEFPAFLLFFTVCPLIAVYIPASNPWEAMWGAGQQRSSSAATIELYHKQEILHLPVTDIVAFIFIRKKCIAVCRQGRQLYSGKLNSSGFASLAESKYFVQIRREVFVQRGVVDGYTTIGRDKYIHFVHEVKEKIDPILANPERYTMSSNPRELIKVDTFKISVTCIKEVRDMLKERKGMTF